MPINNALGRRGCADAYLPRTAWVTAAVEVANEAAEQTVASKAHIRWNWLRHTEGAPGATLVKFVRSFKLSPEYSQVWVGCESEAARTLRSYFKFLGFDRSTLHASGYWKKGAAEHVDAESDY